LLLLLAAKSAAAGAAVFQLAQAVLAIGQQQQPVERLRGILHPSLILRLVSSCLLLVRNRALSLETTENVKKRGKKEN
jgi:hypothetical protein